MLDSLLLLATILGPVQFIDPYPFTPENECQVEFLNRLNYALTWYSDFGKLDSRGETYVRLGPPAWTEKGLKPKADLDLSLSQGKPPELVETEIWGYADLKEPLIFQEKPGGGFYLVRQPEQLVIYASQVQPEINYVFNYDKEKLPVSYVIGTYNFSHWVDDSLVECKDSLEIGIDLILPLQALDSLFLWRLAVQDLSGRVVCRDSMEFIAHIASETVISKSLYVEKDVFASQAGFYTLTARPGYVLTLEVVSKDGKRGNLLQRRIKL